MAENLDSDPLKEAEAKLNKLIESGIDVETLQQLLQTAATNEATIKHPDTSPLNNSTEDGNPKTENIIQEGSGSHENGTKSEELSPDDFAAAPKEIGNVNNDLADESKLDEFENDYKEEDEDKKLAAEGNFTGQSHHIATGSNVNQGQGKILTFY